MRRAKISVIDDRYSSIAAGWPGPATASGPSAGTQGRAQAVPSASSIGVAWVCGPAGGIGAGKAVWRRPVWRRGMLDMPGGHRICRASATHAARPAASGLRRATPGRA